MKSSAGGEVCIYCLRTASDVEFDREHIIPQTVGGTLYVDGMVCKECNSKLGREVDCEILKVPEVLGAMDELRIPYNREGVLRSYYETHLVSERGRLGAQPSAGGLALHSQDLPDGSRIYPKHSGFESELKKTLQRDGTIDKAGISAQKVDRILAHLERRLQDADIDEEVKCPELGLIVVKRSEALSSKIEPKSPANYRRFMAKVAFEWLYFCLGTGFPRSALWVEELHDLVIGEADPRSIYVLRSQPEDPTLRKIHELYFILHPSFTRVVLRLFGGIEYTLIAPEMDPEALQEHRGKVPDALGIAFRQDLDAGEKSFFALRAEGTSVFLGHL